MKNSCKPYLRIPLALFAAALGLATPDAGASADQVLADKIIDCSSAWLRYMSLAEGYGEKVKEAYTGGGYFIDAGVALSSPAYAEKRGAAYRARYFRTMARAETDADTNKLNQAAIPMLETALDECAELRAKHSAVIESKLKEYYVLPKKQAGMNPKNAFAAPVPRKLDKPLAKKMGHCAAVYSSKVMYQTRQTEKHDHDSMDAMQWYFARGVAVSDETYTKAQFTSRSNELLKVVDGAGVPRKGVNAAEVLNGYARACEQLKAENPDGE